MKQSKGFSGFRLRTAPQRTSSDESTPGPIAADAYSSDALARLRPKILDMAANFDTLSEEGFGQWVDSLPKDEFIEFIRLGNEGIGMMVREYRTVVDRHPSKGGPRL
ncbi:hypothetical protein [Paraburkholderia sp. SIMBA_054]|uniref:hypothetical protein n=1 Tax=Paraburkholderia sp. SIMBA_054 TaxID=3085795 RepID=UPI00397B1352